MKYYFILGTNTALSIAEILSFFSDVISYRLLSQDVFILELKDEIDAKDVIKKLGGVIKIGEVFDSIRGQVEYDDVGHLFNTKEGEKFKFGISCYAKFKKLNPKFLAMEIKNHLKKDGVSVRWVTSKEKTLSSVVVEQNKLTTKGIEIVLIEDKKNIIFGRTLAVQDFKNLSFRDYNRPGRDDKSGMLPPKLAQIMINLAGAKDKENQVLHDSFCGSGTVITEAMLMGYKNLIGSDISGKAIADTKTNADWFTEKFNSKPDSLKLINESVLTISEKVESASVDVIVSEPYLGPQRGNIQFEKVKEELEELYTGAIEQFDKILKPGGRIVMLFPVFRIKNESKQINPDRGNFKIINMIPEDLQKKKEINQTGRNTIVYGRENQRVWREVVVLERK